MKTKDPTAVLTHARLRQRKACKHPKTVRHEGPRSPALFGSWETEVCGDCGSWRRVIDVQGGRKRWHHEPLNLIRDEDY